jgi:hypothetical protein
MSHCHCAPQHNHHHHDGHAHARRSMLASLDRLQILAAGLQGLLEAGDVPGLDAEELVEFVEGLEARIDSAALGYDPVER